MKRQQKQLGPLIAEKSTTVFSSKDTLIRPSVLDVLSIERYTFDTDACDKKIWYLLFQRREGHSNRLLTTGPDLSRTRDKAWRQRIGNARQLYGPYGFATLLRCNQLHSQDGP